MNKHVWYACGLLVCAQLAGLCNRAHAQPKALSRELALDASSALPVREEEYALETIQVPFPGASSTPGVGLPSELRVLVIAPDKRGSYPVAVFLHGQAAVCVDPSSGPKGLNAECADGTKVPNHRGFVRYQRALAARGWLTLSVSLNDIIGSAVQNDERTTTQLMAAVAEAHLGRWSAWAGGQDLAAAPKVVADGILPDLKQLLLIGHSRGGAAANQVALRSVTESLAWRARAQVLIGPTLSHYNPAPSVPVVVLLPECDGDVVNLNGQGYVDRARDFTGDTALRSAVLISGANHKFFNAEWDAASATLPQVGDDDAVKLLEGNANSPCGSGAAGRLSGEQQRALGEEYILAAASGLVLGQEGVLPLLDGSPACAAASCSTRVATQALGGRKQPLVIPAASTAAVSGATSMKPCLTAREADQPDACATADMPKVKEVMRTPHFGSAMPRELQPFATSEPSAVALRLDWSTADAPVSIPLTRQPASGATELALRIIAAPGVDAPAFDVAFLDAGARPRRSAA